MNQDFNRLSRLFTGGSSGIGLATATLIQNPGARGALIQLDPLPKRVRISLFAKEDESSLAAQQFDMPAALSQLGLCGGTDQQ